MQKSAPPKISLITVSFGSASKIEKLLTSLRKFLPHVPWELIVVDNNSPQKTQNYHFLKGQKNIHLINLNRNLGFGRGNEEGIGFAEGEFIAFINPDIEIQAGCLDELLKILETDSQVGIAVPVLESKGGQILESTWDFPTLIQLLKRRILSRPSIKAPLKNQSVSWAQGSFLVMRKDFFKKLGGFDPRFFLFFEDTDLCRRCWETGKKVVQVPDAKAFHAEHRLSGGNIFLAVFKKTFWIHLLSTLKYFAKYKGGKTPPVN